MKNIHIGNYEYRDTSNKFWTEEHIKDLNYKIMLDKTMMLDFLEFQGFYRTEKMGAVIYIRITLNIVHIVNFQFIQDYILEYIREASIDLADKCSNEDIIKALVEGGGKYLNPNLFSMLKKKKIKITGDDKDTSYFYFANGTVRVTKDNIEELKYNSEHGQLWRDQIKPFNFRKTDTKSDFEIFVKNVCDNDEQRFEAMKSAVGYLINTYKNESLTKAVVFYDESISRDGSLLGRNGKSLICKSLNYIREVADIKGQDFKSNERFKFQRINMSTEIILINDIEKNFKIEKIFSNLSEGWDVEKKGRDRFQIPFKDSPKLVLTTNYSILGSGSSFVDRLHEIPFSNYYSDKNKPIDDFGKNFFDDWTKDEWNAFFMFLFSCSQVFLSKGLIKYQSTNLGKKKLLQRVGETFFEFAENIILEIKHDKKDMYSFYKKEFGDDRVTSQKAFTLFLSHYSKYKGYNFIETKSNRDNFFMFTKPKSD